MRCRLERVPLDRVPWGALDSLPGRSVFCTREWLTYLERSQRVTPVVARVLIDDRPRGWFTGAVAHRSGVRLLGSPLPGWGTSYMGVEWDDPSDAELTPVALAAVRRWASGSLRCAHFEVLVRVAPAGFELPPGTTLGIFHSYRRLLVDDDALLAGMSSNGRRNVRRAERFGVRVEEVGAHGADDFVDVCYRQLAQAFARRGTRPSYSVARVRELVDAVHPSGHLLLLRARDAAGRTAATSISAGLPGGTAVFLMGAGDPELLDVRPNEAVMWAAMRRWRDRGAVDFDFGGGGTYKRKFGAEPVDSVWLRGSVVPGTEPMRNWARRTEARRRARRHVGGAQPVGE